MFALVNGLEIISIIDTLFHLIYDTIINILYRFAIKAMITPFIFTLRFYDIKYCESVVDNKLYRSYNIFESQIIYSTYILVRLVVVLVV